MSTRNFRGWSHAALVAIIALTGCSESPKKPQPGSSLPPAAASLWMEFSGERALEHVRAQVAFGPRPSGTTAIEKARVHIAETLKAAGWETARQEFVASPVAGKNFKFVNIVARFPLKAGTPAATDTQRAIIGSHYDTKYMPGVEFVGANDAGSSTGALLEMARVLAKVPELATQVELVFFDGEEALVEFSQDAVNGPDGLVGSRHYAGQLRTSGRAAQFRFAIVWDMIGDKNFGLTLPSDSPAHLVDALNKAATSLSLATYIKRYNQPLLDDHVPIQAIARIPSMDMIDFEYPSNHPQYPVWHTAADTMDKLSPDGLRITGQLTLSLLAAELGK